MRARISADEQRVIYSMKNSGLSFQQIARIIGCSLTTAERHYYMEEHNKYCKTSVQTRRIDWSQVYTGLMSVRDTTEKIEKKYAETEQS